ncbi:centrosome-associated protein 350 isoform X2 [Nematostella vectensis]|uniref:centrosome-associated protein 350 isoform X2 n=1 Tax=Nematostella vectensis TaxID=45351 RepID=UPI00207776DC|nr:centrosome-associated protein 350 isoform X2 [Nematostella vectensis]
MSSSAGFRARRIQDPVPKQRGALGRTSRKDSALTGLEAALENVGQARNALEAVEARIQQANLPLGPGTTDEEEFVEPRIRQVFSERQRYGRVTRYELRPGANRPELSPRLSEAKDTRHSLEYTSDGSRASSRNSTISSIQDKEESGLNGQFHSPPSRDVQTISPPYINDSDAILDTSNEIRTCMSSVSPTVPRSASKQDISRKLPVSRYSNMSGTMSNFEDSLEISRRSADGRPLSGLCTRPLINNNSDVLARLKEKIQKQKEQASKSPNYDIEPIPVPLNSSAPPPTEEAPFVPKAVTKRKFAAGPPAPVYKGFSEAVPPRPQSRDSRISSRVQSRAGSQPPSRAGKSQQNQRGDTSKRKGQVKVQRIVAPKRPTSVISTTSWRTGQETVNKILGLSKKPNPGATAAAQPTLLSHDNSSRSKSSLLEWRKEPEKVTDTLVEKENPQNGVEEHMEGNDVQGDKEENELSQHTLELSSEEDHDMDDVRNSRVLSEEARNILSDLDLDNNHSVTEEKAPAVLESKPSSNSSTQQPKKAGKKRKATSGPQKQDKNYPKEKVRHYDVDQVKKYMEKQLAERKKKMRQEKEMKRKAVEERKKRLDALYFKQKKTVAHGLANKEKCRPKDNLGETFNKVQADFLRPPIILGYHQAHPRVEYYSDGTEVSESDKENQDVASFEGLPSYERRRQTQPRAYIEQYDSQSLPSTLSSDSDEHHVQERDTPVIDTSPSLVEERDASKTESAHSINQERVRGAAFSEALASESPNRAERIAAIHNTAAALKQRLEQEAKRLGLTLQVQGGAGTADRGVFRGALPGVDNMREQAELNEELESKNTAATKIQAAYRGHSTRQGLNWKLPSGRTFGAAMREGRRQTPSTEIPEGDLSQVSRYSTAMEDQEEYSSMSEVRSGYSTGLGDSLASHNSQVGQLASQRAGILNTGGLRPVISDAASRPEPWIQSTADSMSVINIFMRNHPNVKQDKAQENEPGSETANLLSGIEDKSGDTASLLEDVPEKDADKTIVPESPSRAGGEEEEDQYNDDDFTLESEAFSPKPSASPEGSYSASFASPFCPLSCASPSRSTHKQHSLSSLSLSEGDTSSTEPSLPTAKPSASSNIPPAGVPFRIPPSVFQPNHLGGDRMSPGTLDHCLMAELNRLEYMEESVRQLGDIERTKHVASAQQETVSLAQILKARQAAHTRDMEALRLKAKQEALDSAKQLDEARRSAAVASMEAQNAVAMVRSETAAAVAKATDELVRAQAEAAKANSESARQVAEAQTAAARSLLEAANQRTDDIYDVTTAAATSAAQAAVMATIKQYRHGQRDDSLTSYSGRSPSSSKSRSTRPSDSTRRSDRSPSRDGYTSDEFDSFKESDRNKSLPVASDTSADQTSVYTDQIRSREKSEAASASIPEEVDLSVAEGSLESEDDSVREALSSTSKAKKKNEAGDYSMAFEESMLSSHTATDDELEYRMVLPSEGHRRRSIGSRSSIASDIFSSDENQDNHVSDAQDKHTPAALFSGGEDSFNKFTVDMVHQMKQEEVRAKHQEALLRLREKALKEKTKAELAWLELQKQRHRDKGADDVMPSIRKRQRGLLMRLQAGQAEIKRLKAANRAASYERKLLLLQQEEIADLRRSTKEIREKVKAEKPRDQKSAEGVEQSPEKPSTSRVDRAQVSETSPSKSGSVPEEFSAVQSPSTDSSFPTYDEHEPKISGRDRKRSFSEGESDEGSAGDRHIVSALKSPSSDSLGIMQRLNKRRIQSSERYLTQREQKIIGRRQKAEDLLASQRKLIEWQQRLDAEESEVQRLLNQALGIQAGARPSPAAEHRAAFTENRAPSAIRDIRVRSVTPPGSTSSPSKKTETPSERLPSKRSLSERSDSISEDLPSIPPESKSRESSIPEVATRTQSHDSTIPEGVTRSRSQDTTIPEEYVNDTFESLDSTMTPTHSTPVRKASPARDSLKQRSSSKEDEQKSEEETSMTETSDYSDVEGRVRLLKEQLEQRKREAQRLYHERKRQRRAMLRAQEASLRKELQAVELVIQKIKAELDQPTDRPRSAESRPSSYGVRGVTLSPLPLDQEPRPSDKQQAYTPPSESSKAPRSPQIRDAITPREPVSASDRTSTSEPSGRTSVGAPARERDPSVIDVYSSDARDSSRADSETDGDRLKDLPLAVDLNDSKDTSEIKTQSQVKDLDISDRSTSIAEELSDRHSGSSEVEEDIKIGDSSISEASEIRSLSQVSREDSKRLDINEDIPASVASVKNREPSKANDYSYTFESEKEDLKTEASVASVKSREPSKANDYSYTFESEKEDLKTEASVASVKSREPSKAHDYRFTFKNEKQEPKTEDDISDHISLQDNGTKETDSEHLEAEGDSLIEVIPESPEKGDSRSDSKASTHKERKSLSESDASIDEEQSDATISERIHVPEEDKESPGVDASVERPQSRESALSGYSEDFEPSEGEESVKSEQDLENRVEYTPDFGASESKGTKASDPKEKNPYTADIEPGSSIKEKTSYSVDFEASESEKTPDVSEREKSLERSAENTPEKEEIPTDEESVVEDLPEEELTLEESEGESEASTPRLSKQTREVMASEDVKPRETGGEDEPGQTVEMQDLTKESVKKVEDRADRITDAITGMLLNDALSCVSNIYQAHQQTSGLATSEDRTDPAREKRTTEKGADRWPEEFGEISEAEDVSISEKLSFSGSERFEKVLRVEKDEGDKAAVPSFKFIEPTSRTQTRSDAIVNQLSEDLVQQAISQMISVMRKKREKQQSAEGKLEKLHAKLQPADKKNEEKGQERPHLKLHLGDKHEEHDSASPCSSETSPRFFDKYMAVHRFPDGIHKQHSPPGSPTKDKSALDGHELADKLTQLKLLHDELGHQLDDDNDNEFDLNTDKELELPPGDDVTSYARPRGLSITYVVPHRYAEVSDLVASSLSKYYALKQAGHSISNVQPPPEITDAVDANDPNAASKQSYQKLVFDLTGDVFRDILHEESPPARPLWMKQRRRQKSRIYRSLTPLRDEDDYLQVVQSRVMNLIGLGTERPNLETLRRKTPLKAGKKDAVDAILIQELREEEPQWVDYDDDELAVKFQVADAILDSLLSETVMVMNAIQDRRDASVNDMQYR